MFTSALATAGSLATVGVKLVGTGFCLGVGFWLAQKATGPADQLWQQMLMYDKDILDKVVRERIHQDFQGARGRA